MASVRFHNITKVFDKVEVLHGVSLDIADGEFTVLVGPSGCGKSTLLRLLAGLEEVSSGEITINDRVVNEVESKDRDIAMVFQSYALYPHMTVRENMGFSLRLRKTATSLIEERVAEAARILDLAPYLNRLPRELSGGQRQRVAMGRAIVRDPQVFLFDEPLSNLDAKLRAAMRAEIKSLHQRLRTTTVYVTHDQIEAMTMADRIAVMNAGRIEQVGEPLELYDRPVNLFVAQFIGSPAMNIMRGTLSAANGGCMVEALGALWPIPAAMNLAPGRRVHYGIRPEHLRLSDGPGIEGFIAVVEPLGAGTELVVRVGDTQLVLVSNYRPAVHSNDSIRLVVDAEHVHLFDEVSGMRID
ncbi:MAG: ABC transporter ATP-binding protein [Betaproteobacteria bacterium]